MDRDSVFHLRARTFVYSGAPHRPHLYKSRKKLATTVPIPSAYKGGPLIFDFDLNLQRPAFTKVKSTIEALGVGVGTLEKRGHEAFSADPMRGAAKPCRQVILSRQSG